MDKKLLDLYSDYLLSSFGATTATGLSSLLDGQISHDQVTRFLSQAEYTSKELWHQVKTVVRTIEREDGVLIFDDTIQEKPHTDENELICWHFDHSKNRSVKGLNLLNSHMKTPLRRSIKNDGKSKSFTKRSSPMPRWPNRRLNGSVPKATTSLWLSMRPSR